MYQYVYTLPNMDFSGLTGFEWDEGNLKKVFERIEPSVAEMAFQGEPWVALSRRHSGAEKRWFLVNKVVKRHVFVVFTIRENKIRIVSARYMHRKEVKFYEKKFRQEK